MMSHRMWSGLFYAGGVLSMLLGLEHVSTGQTCTSVLYSPAHCTNAHGAPPIPSASQQYCHWQSNNCEKTVPSSCADRWGVAHTGECKHVFGTTSTYECYLDAHLTLVNVWWYLARCQQNNGDCNCKWEPSSTTQTLQLCDCYDVLVED